MMVRYVLHVQKAIRVVRLISTALFVALNNEESEMCFYCINCNVNCIGSCLKRCRINHAEINESMSKLSL